MVLKKKKKVAKKTGKKKVAKKKRPLKARKPQVRRKSVARKKSAKKKPAKAKKQLRPAKLKADVIGIVTHYFPHVRAAVIKLNKPLAIGEQIKIKGHTTDFTQVVRSMQIDRVDITSAKKGDEIGLEVESRVRQHDQVLKA